MELEYRDHSRRNRWLVVLGIVLAVVAGGGAYYLVNEAQQRAGQGSLQRVAVVVAARTIAARKIIEAEDVVVREIPIDPTNAQGIVSTPDKVIGRVPAVTLLGGQMILTNALASSTEGGQFSILGPDESVSPDSAPWRAVSVTVPDERAVGGLLEPNQAVDVFVTASVNVLSPETTDASGYYSDKSTKITYQNVVVLAKSGTSYILKMDLPVAEEVAHLQASGTASFSLALRPDADSRIVDAKTLGTTTNRIIIRYGLPIPVLYPPARGPLPSAPPVVAPTAAPSASPAGAASIGSPRPTGSAAP